MAPLMRFGGRADRALVSAGPTESRLQRAVFETDSHLVVGNVSLPPEGYQSRLSDAVNRGDLGFIPLTDVEITPIEGGETVRRGFALLGKAHVKLAYPFQEAG
jgi:hypothetical protein